MTKTIITRLKLIDINIGKRIRYLRKLYNISQKDLGKALGVGAQQMSKYELGKDRIAASKLPILEEILQTRMTRIIHGEEPLAIITKPFYNAVYNFSRLDESQRDLIIKLMYKLRKA